jgi:hypothetical protein
MTSSLGTRARAALVSTAAIGLAVLAAAPASAATTSGTPSTPTELFNAYQACSTDASAPLYVAGRDGLIVEGIPNDSATGITDLTVQYQLWPVSDPTQIVTGSDTYAIPGNEASVNIGGGTLTDGQDYAWQARTVDPSGTASSWSAPCYVADDDTAPTVAPTISSVNYPTGQSDQGGAPVKLTLGANGVSDVAGFEYSWNGTLPVPVADIGAHGIPQWQDPYSDPTYWARATTLGGSTTVSLIPPQDTGYLRLTVISLDRALNQSPETTYDIWLKPDGPTVTQLSHPAVFGKPTAFKLTPNPALEAASPVVSYTVVDMSSQGQTSTTVKACADGSAELTLALKGIYGDMLSVTSTSADGWVSEAGSWNNGSINTAPTVASAVYPENGTGGGTGTAGTFTFTPNVKGVASYTYSFNGGTPVTVKARADGSAQISWTPSQSGWYDLNVYATTRSGIQLAPYDYYFTVD